MSQLLLLLWSFSGPSAIIKLESQDAPVRAVDNGSRGRNGDFFAIIDTTLWHWNASGKLLRTVGGKGDSDEKLSSLVWYHWDGEYYWLGDGERLGSPLYDEHGRFLSRSPSHFRHIIDLGPQILALDYSDFDIKSNRFPRVLQEIEYEVNEGRVSVSKGPLLFKKVTQRQVNYQGNYKMVWVVREGDTYLVVDEMEPKIWIYDPASRAAETEAGAGSPFAPNHMPLQLSRYILPMPTPVIPSDMKVSAWLASWSRINYFAKSGKGYLVGYTVPDPENETRQLQVAELLMANGKTTGKTVTSHGLILGHQKGKVFFIVPKPLKEPAHFAVHVHHL